MQRRSIPDKRRSIASGHRMKSRRVPRTPCGHEKRHPYRVGKAEVDVVKVKSVGRLPALDQ